MKTDDAYVKWMNGQIKSAQGERLERLRKGQGHAEKLFWETVWWPAFGSYDDLHAEYEVTDYKGGPRYLDYAFIRGQFQVCIEIDGFGPHGTRSAFRIDRHRQLDFIIDGWKIARFAYDDVNENPRYCQQKLQQLFGRWLGDSG